MASIHAYLDDFGKITVLVSRHFYDGKTDGFYITNTKGYYKDCLIQNVEDLDGEVRYSLTIPAEYEFGVEYTLHEQHGQNVIVEIRSIVRKKHFDTLFDYDGDDLGSTYYPTHTKFALWAPTAISVCVKIWNKGKEILVAMRRQEKGVYRCDVEGDFQHALYQYLVERNGKIVASCDPYGLSSDANSVHSAVINLQEITKIEKVSIPTKFKSATDAIIYEASVRDMTSSLQTGSVEHGTYAALAQAQTTWKGHPTGFDYLTGLGITHVQFQPVLDFATVDENHPERDYNWGYDPLQLITLEGSYTRHPEDPYARMKEFKTLVSTLHKRGIRVNLDVVFNHMYDVERSCFDRCVPYYYFRYNQAGYLTNGSYCGNDLDSKRPMMRRYFQHVIRLFIQLYDVDGFRFDLMGILDVETMNCLVETAKKCKPEAMMYGEGWDMPTDLAPQEKATIVNQNQMPILGFFNDTFRDIIKGKTGDSEGYVKGYATGDGSLAFDACSALAGNVLQDPYFYRFDDPGKSINACETHDNATVWDKMHACCSEEPREVRKKRAKMILACTLFAQGVPFLHQGQEFGGTKKDHSNSYRAGDAINGMNWDRMCMNWEMVEYTKACIQLRKNNPCFRYADAKSIQKNVSFTDLGDGCLQMQLLQDYDTLQVFVNPTGKDLSIHKDESWSILLNQDGLAQLEATQEILVPACSVIVAKKK